MQLLTYLPDLFEMIATVAALAVTWLKYREVRRDRDKRDE